MYAFPKSRRLLVKDDFKKVFDKPNKIGCPYYVVLYRKSLEDAPRLGLVIAKKKVKKSVDRIKIKRIIRESFRMNQNQLKKADFVFIASAKINELTKAELRQLLDNTWIKLEKS